MARTTRSLEAGDTTVVSYNVFLHGPKHMHLNNDVPLDVALVSLGVIDPKHQPVVVRITTEVLGNDPRAIAEMAGIV